MGQSEITRECRKGKGGEAVAHTLGLDELTVGHRLGGRYTVAQKLGQGGMGAVYLCTDDVTGDRVAVKVLSDELCHRPSFLARFQREMRVTQGLSHPHIVPVRGVGDEQGRPFLVMAYLPGQTLEDRLSLAPLPLADIRRVVRALGEGLAYIHARGLIHRDVKSANVMLGPDGEVWLLDFGVLRDTHEQSSTQDGYTVGTPCYMAPEQAVGDPLIDHRADQYALGVLAFEMLTGGRLPYEESSDSKRLTLQLTRAAPDVRQHAPHLSELVALVLKRAMAGQSEDRYASMEAFLFAFDRAFQVATRPLVVAAQKPHIAVAKAPVRPAPDTREAVALALPSGTKWALWGAVAVAALMSFLGLGWKRHLGNRVDVAARNAVRVGQVDVPTETEIQPARAGAASDGAPGPSSVGLSDS